MRIRAKRARVTILGIASSREKRQGEARQNETRRARRNETKRSEASRVESRRVKSSRVVARRGKSKFPARLHRSREGMRPPRRDEDTGRGVQGREARREGARGNGREKGGRRPSPVSDGSERDRPALFESGEYEQGSSLTLKSVSCFPRAVLSARSFGRPRSERSILVDRLRKGPSTLEGSRNVTKSRRYNRSLMSR